jgi:hypothetical protein
MQSLNAVFVWIVIFVIQNAVLAGLFRLFGLEVSGGAGLALAPVSAVTAAAGVVGVRRRRDKRQV